MTWRANILNHYRTVWGTDPEPCPFSAGPVRQLPLDFSVIKFLPRGRRRMWTYATCCMSQPVDHRPIELHMFSLWESAEVVELLVATAHYHRTAAKLDLGHSVNFGRPWIGISRSEYGLVSLPYLDGPSLENLKTDSKELKFYWLIPVTHSEVEFKKRNGLESLEELFDRAGFDFLNPERSAVA